MNRINDKVRAECQRLRVEERLTIGQIRERLHISQGTVSGIIKEYKLTPEELALKRVEPWNKGAKKYDEQESTASKIAVESGLTPNQKGKVAEVAVLFRICLRGFEVYQAQFDCERADWLLVVDGKTFKLQVKLMSHGPHGMPTITLRRNSGQKKYVKGDFDVIVGYDIYSDTAHVFRWDEVNGKTSVSASDSSREAWNKIRA